MADDRVKEIDCRGLACPGPVLKAKNVIDDAAPAVLRVMVDNEAAVQNVSRFLGTRHYKVSAVPGPEGTCVQGISEGESTGCEVTAEPHQASKILVLVSNDRMGHGDDVLGKKLMISFLSTLKEMGRELWRLVLINNGVKLTVEGSDLLVVLAELEKESTILVCGTCLTHFGLLEKKQVGQTTNMLDIVTAMQLADKVITV
jgi:selenium metabolism protein YedF